MHSHQFKNNEYFKNKSVLVVGGGNSACDIAVEISRVAKKTSISEKRISLHSKVYDGYAIR